MIYVRLEKENPASGGSGSYKKKKSTSARGGKSVKKEPGYPHFRYYKPSKHPALIVEERSKEEFNYRKVMHSERDGNRKNEKVYPNPNPKDNRPMYIGKRIRHDKKNKFDGVLPWKYPSKKKK